MEKPIVERMAQAIDAELFLSTEEGTLIINRESAERAARRAARELLNYMGSEAEGEYAAAMRAYADRHMREMELA